MYNGVAGWSGKAFGPCVFKRVEAVVDESPEALVLYWDSVSDGVRVWAGFCCIFCGAVPWCVGVFCSADLSD